MKPLLEHTLGRFRFVLRYREVEGDHGLTIHVFGPAGDTTEEDNTEEVLRFDCFEHTPHYHTAFSYQQKPFVPISAQDPFGWSLDALRSQTNQLLEQADAEPMNPVELGELRALVDEIEARGRAHGSPTGAAGST